MPLRYSRARRAFERFRHMDTRTNVFEREWDCFKCLYWHDKREEPGGETVFEFGFWTGRRDQYHTCKLVFPRWEVKQTASLVVATHETRGVSGPPLVTHSFELRSFDRLVDVLDSCRWYGDMGIGRIPHVWREDQLGLYVRWEE